MDLGPPTLTPADVAAGFTRVFVVLLGILLLASVIRRAAKRVVLRSAAYAPRVVNVLIHPLVYRAVSRDMDAVKIFCET